MTLENLENLLAEQYRQIYNDNQQLARTNADLVLAKNQVKTLNKQIKNIKRNIEKHERYVYLYRYQQKLEEVLPKYNAFWTSIEDGSNPMLLEWQEELDSLPNFAHMRDWANIPTNNAKMLIYFRDSLCSYSIIYLPMSDPMYPTSECSTRETPFYYLCITNLLAGDFVEEYIPVNEQSIQYLLLHMYNLNILKNAKQDILNGNTRNNEHSLFYGKEDGRVTNEYINDIKTLHIHWEQAEDGRYYPSGVQECILSN